MHVISDYHQERWKSLCHTEYSIGSLALVLEVGQKPNAGEMLPISNNTFLLKWPTSSSLHNPAPLHDPVCQRNLAYQP